MNFDKLLASEEKVIDTATLKIEKNILCFKDYFLQISNISQVSIAPVKKHSYPIFAFVLVIIGILLARSHYEGGVTVGILLIVCGGFFIYTVYKKNSDLGEVLSIELNSGSIFWFIVKDRPFLNEIIDVLQSCANNKLANYIIDIQNSTITVGDKNVVEVDNTINLQGTD
ncbi:hypothetical protein [Syntrophomonas curvata]